MATRELSTLPSMAPLLARAAVGVIPGASRLPFIAGGGSELPELTLLTHDVAIDRPRLEAYDRLCGVPPGETLPSTYPHLLAFPLALALMTDGGFPFAPVGLVHIAHEITQHRPIRAAEKLTLEVSATSLRPHPHGLQFTLRSRGLIDGELVWEELATNLRRGAPPVAPATPATPAPKETDAGALSPVATWELPADLGRQYGRISGDLNPIHLHPLSARLLGFSSAIAHGMWTLARCLAELEPRLASAFTVSASFRRPILLPATVRYAEHAEHAEHVDGAGPISFGVLDPSSDAVHLLGSVG